MCVQQDQLPRGYKKKLVCACFVLVFACYARLFVIHYKKYCSKDRRVYECTCVSLEQAPTLCNSSTVSCQGADLLGLGKRSRSLSPTELALRGE